MDHHDRERLAQHWFVRMRAPNVSARERREHAAFLEASTENRAAYARVEREWQELDCIREWAGTELRALERQLDGTRHRVSWFRRLGLAAGAGALALATLWLAVTLPRPETLLFETMSGEQRQFALRDGSRVHLNSDSSAEVRFGAEIREVRLTRGEGLFDVAHERHRPFVVVARERRVVALGTKFSVRLDDTELAVTVVEGRVELVSPGRDAPRTASADPDRKEPRPAVVVEPNQQLRIEKSGALTLLEDVPAANLTAWERGLLIFDAEPLRSVARQMSRQLAGDIVVAEGVPDFPVTGVIVIRDAETMLSLLSEIVPVVPVRRTGQLTVLQLDGNAASPADG